MASGILLLVAREKQKEFPLKCDMRKCRNWQTSKTKDLVSIALVWVQVPSSAWKVLTFSLSFVILSFVARESENSREMRYAEVSELADEQD